MRVKEAISTFEMTSLFSGQAQNITRNIQDMEADN